MSYLRVCAVSELPRDGVRRVEINGVPVVIVRSDDEFFALSDVCSHDEVALSDGELEGTTLECWLHGARFDVRTGRPLCGPATESVPVYDVKLDADQLHVSTVPSALVTAVSPSAVSSSAVSSSAVSSQQESVR